MDIHNYKRRFERTLERIHLLDIPQQEKDVILRFKDMCICEGISYGKIDAYLFYLMKLVPMFKKPFHEATKEDLRAIVAEINQSDYSEETKVSIKIVLRKLYKMLRGVEEKGKYPDEVAWIRTTIPKNHKKLPPELLTEDEITEIIRSAANVRDKALIATLAESGCRVSEIGTMQIKHVSFETYGARLTVSGKTGTRKILIIHSTPYLQEWINQHPLNNDSAAYLWYNPQARECLGYGRITDILKSAAKRAGIKKNVYPHLLRHSKATHLAPIMSEAAMKQYFGWTQTSKMAGVYVHMSGKDTDDAILRANGIEVKKDVARSPLQPKNCLRCKTLNEFTNRFCKLCGLALNEITQKELIDIDIEREKSDTLMESLVNDKDVLQLLIQKIKENGLDKSIN